MQLDHKVGSGNPRIFAQRGFTAEPKRGKLGSMATRKSAASPRQAVLKPRRKAGKLAPSKSQRGPTVTEIPCGIDTAALASLAALIREVGGAALGGYLEPLGSVPILLASVPLAAVQPTPFQRDLSPTHAKRLAEKINETGSFLDPLIVVRGEDGKLWTPNGRHRLAAAKMLGLRQITALICPDESLAYRILALNTEKAHNLKERALEVIRIYRGLLDEDGSRAESGFAFYLEDPALVTIGVCYETQPRFAGGAYHPVLRRVSKFDDAPIAQAIKVHEKHAKMVLEIEARVGEVIARLREKGLTSPYLRSFVVSRINPLRWIQGEVPPAEKVLETMRERAAKFNVEKVKQEDLARAGGAVDEE